MLLVSQNLVNYDMALPSNITLRVNLAWVNDYKQLSKILDKSDNDFFLDVPLGRLKPPNNIIPLDKVKEFVNKYPKIKYLAISNVESDQIIKKFVSLFGTKVKIVPKIETISGVQNIINITDGLPYSEKILMLDHDDLFVDVSKSNHSPDFFKELVNNLILFCKSKEIKLLRVRGIIFSDSIIYDTML